MEEVLRHVCPKKTCNLTHQKRGGGGRGKTKNSEVREYKRHAKSNAGESRQNLNLQKHKSMVPRCS